MARVERVPATLRSFRWRVLTGTTLTLLVATTWSTPSGAIARRAAGPPTVDVSTDPTGAHVRLGRGAAWIEIRGPRDGGASGDGGSATTGCQRRWVPTKFPNFLNSAPVNPDIHLTPMPPRPGPAYVAYYVYCGAAYITSVWLLPSAFAPAAAVVDVRAIAEQLVRDLPYPDAFIHISPDARGLTGLESWFWVTGYTGVIRDAVDEFGIRVEVEAQPGSVSWSFGDETPTQSGTLGRATPARSDVAHTYQQRSKGTPLAVRATVRLDVRYRVDAAPWQTLEPVSRTAARGYPVAESRAALVPSR